jgi:1-acyl-sn-glycerol-3-phosphate acyltransferase
MIIAPNHVSYYDPPIIAAGIRWRVRFMAWDALFKVPLLRKIMIGYGAYPIKLKSADKSAIAQTLKILRNGEAVMIFAEGARSPDGNLLPFQQGPARLADQTGAAIVPVTILGAFESWPMGRALPRLFVPINIKYHPAVFPADLPPELSPKERANELNARVAAPIARRLRAWQKLKEKKKIRKL